MLNDWFTHSYGRCMKALERRIYEGALPVLIRLGDDAIMLRGQQRSTARILSDRYHALKSVCHVPIALYLDLRERCEAPLASDDIARLGALRAELSAFAGEDEPMRDVLNAAVRFIDKVRAARRIDQEGLTAFERQTRAPVRACIELAAHEELETLHGQVREFTRTFSDAEWQGFRVVICASHQPRYRQSAKQYFKRLLLDNHGVEEQVLYGENCRTEQEALQLLATHLLDRDLAAFFLDSPLDLQQDVLGDAAQRVVSRLFA